MSASTPTMAPSSASTVTFFGRAIFTTCLLRERFSSNGFEEASIITEVHPDSMHSLIRSKSLQWSRCRAIGTLDEPASCLTHEIIAGAPQKMTVLADVWIITG